MATIPPVLDPVPPPNDATSATKIEAFGIKLEIPLPKWAVGCFAVLLIATAVVAGVYFSATRIGKSAIIPQAQMEVYEETNFHLVEPKELKEIKEEAFNNNMTTVTLNFFKSDGCVQIVRWDAATSKGDGLWMFGPHPHSVGHIHQESTTLASPSPNPLPDSAKVKLVSYKPSLDADPFQLHPVQGGRCVDPHPGTFSVMNQPVNQCLVQVWRTFYDGCVHYQFFNPCTGTWDVFPNGAPHVTWTRCIH